MKKNSKKYDKERYQKNKERVIEKSKKYYLEHREHILEYLKARRKRDYKLASIRRRKNPEKYRNYESLWAHKNRKRVAEKRREEQSLKYQKNQEATPSTLKCRVWKKEEIDYLRDNYKTKTILEMAQVLGRTWAATSKKLNQKRFIKLERRIDNLIG